MYRIRITGGTPGTSDPAQSFDDPVFAERVAKAILSYLARNRPAGVQQGVQVVDEQGRWLWRQNVAAPPERLN